MENFKPHSLFLKQEKCIAGGKGGFFYHQSFDYLVELVQIFTPLSGTFLFNNNNQI